jgi:hypothetical protein
MMLDAFMISLIRQGVALYKRGYKQIQTPTRWAVIGQAAFANGGIPREEVTEEQYYAALDGLASEFVGTPLYDELHTWPTP